MVCLFVGNLIYSKFGPLNQVYIHFLLNYLTKIRDSPAGFLVSMAPPNRSKEEFWIELNDLGNLVAGPWCVA